MVTAPAFRFVVALAAAVPLYAADAQAQFARETAPRWTAEELENLLAPVALYPDPILAQVLVAAAYPDEVELAAQHVRLYGQEHVDDQPWDISVRAVAHYPPVLNLMADRGDWMVALGEAYADQPEDVMAAVQSLRAMARAHGNLVTTPEHDVVVEERYIRILPAHPRVVYVPVYDPYIVYYRPVVHLGIYRSGWSFGIAFPIGVWLTYDFNWRRRHVYYHGWDPYYRDGWIHRSRPFIVINNIYIRPRPTVVVIDRNRYRRYDRYIDYDRFDRYNYVHRQVDWSRHRSRDDRRYADGPSWDRYGRPAGIADVNRVSSWDGGRDRADGSDRTAVPRTRSGDPAPGDRTAPPPGRTRPEGAQPPRARPRTSEPRTQTRTAEPPRIQPRASEPARTRPERTQPLREQLRATDPRTRTERAQPRTAEPPRIQPRASEPARTRPERTQSMREQLRSAGPRIQPQRTQPQRAQPQRAQPQRTQPQRAQPQRTQPQRAQPQRTQPQRAQPPRARPKGERPGG